MARSPLSFPAPHPGLHRDHGRFWRWVGRTYFRLSGWRIAGTFPLEPKCVAIVAPHTSNWDFPLGVAFLLAGDWRASWLGKHTLFKGYAGKVFRRIGGIPVDRSAPQGLVGECVRAFEAAEALLLAVAPEGTRKGVSKWRTGFYQIALGAQVPILPVAFDYKEHLIHLHPVFHPTGDAEADLAFLQTLLGAAQGLKARPAG
jgi:1-acyl-sn-glycerol-3-phosphate acyltransferase